MSALVLRGDARALPLPDASVDLLVTSPPYFALRSYTDGGEHYQGQIGSEPTPAAYVDSLIDCTREWMRVLKPFGSLWVNLGDKYAGGGQGGNVGGNLTGGLHLNRTTVAARKVPDGIRAKSLLGLPWRYALRCIDDLGLILRAEVIWSKPNGLPESATDRVRRSHEQWFHLVKQPRYFSAVDEIRQPHTDTSAHALSRRQRTDRRLDLADAGRTSAANPLGALPGSVWEIAEGPGLVRLILQAVADGALTVEEGERLWTGVRSSSSTTSTSPATAGNGSAGKTLAATAKPPASVNGVKSGPTDSPTSCSSDLSPKDSPSTTPAATSPASGQNTLTPSPEPRTSGEHGPSGSSAQPGTPSTTLTSSGLATAKPAVDAVPASWDGHEHVETIWTVPTEPLRVPPELGIDHFAAFATELPRRIILGWSPSGICTACEEGRRPIITATHARPAGDWNPSRKVENRPVGLARPSFSGHITGEACACPDTTAPTQPAVVVDPFGGTGTTALVAAALGRHGVSVDRSADYCRLAAWRTTDRGEIAKAMRVPKPPRPVDGQEVLDLFA